MPKTAIQYVTFSRDRTWLDYSLRSFRKYAKGFSGITIVVPLGDVPSFLPLEQEYGTTECPVLIKNFLEYPGKGFVHHLAMKCYADVFQPDADFILHMDPDCLWLAPVTPNDYFVDEKPVLVIESYADLLKAKAHQRYNWKFVTEMALKFECPYETMCRHPAVHHKWLYKAMREHVERVHLTPFIDFVLKQKNSWPQGFGEFNTLGAYAVEKHRNAYHLIDRTKHGDPPSKVWQGWSYTGSERADNQAKIREILA